MGLIAAGSLFSVAMYIETQFSMLFTPNGLNWASFRLLGPADQLSYLAEVVNAAHGNFAAVEPFTETGSNSDPHLYYQVLGAISHITGFAPAEVWNVTGVLLQVLLVVCISVASVFITRRWWAACLGVLPFLVGTLSFAHQSSGAWYSLMQSHAVLWGAFAVMFPLNSESASLCIAGSLFVVLLATAIRRARPRTMMVIGIVVGAGIGLLASFHTYGFLAAIYVGIYGLAAYAIAVNRRWWPVGLSVVLVVVLFLVGPPFASTFGQLLTVALGLLPALPGVVLAIMRWRARVVAPLVAAIACASPQVLGTLLALRSGNAFLKYREASSLDLGVTWKDGLICAAPLLIPLLLIFVAGIQRKQPLWIAYAAGLVTAWLLLAKNDVWGANQEPYRLWIDVFALAAFTIVPMAVTVTLDYLSPREAVGSQPSPRVRAVVASLVVVVLIVVGISSIDWFRFYKTEEGQTMSLSTLRDRAMESVASVVTGQELILADPCIDPEVLKAVTGARIVDYSPGIAWPAHVGAINAVQATVANSRVLTPNELRAADIGWVMTDGTCATNWAVEYSKILIPVVASLYGPSAPYAISLWRVDISSQP